MHDISYSRFNESCGSVFAICTVILELVLGSVDTFCTHTYGRLPLAPDSRSVTEENLLEVAKSDSSD